MNNDKEKFLPFLLQFIPLVFLGLNLNLSAKHRDEDLTELSKMAVMKCSVKSKSNIFSLLKKCNTS